MRIVETALGTRIGNEPNSSLGTIIAGTAQKFLPAANPDFDRRYSLVRKWWIEVDGTGTPQRELGFDPQGIVILAGPLGDNFGFWTDSTMTFDPAEYKVIPEEEFEAAWSLF